MTDSIEFTSAAAALEQVRDLGRRGEFFRQADLAGAAVVSFPQEWALQHAHVLAIANAGGLTHAKELYRDYCLGDIASVDARTLKARLLKDTALAAAPEHRQRLLQEAARAYEAAIEGAANAYYPQDNAAQLYYLAGDREQALHHAGRVLTDLAGLEATGADARWQLASRLNAHIIRGEFDKAQEISKDEYDALPGLQQGAIEYYRREVSGRETLISKAEYDESGPAIVHRKCF